MPTRKKYWLMKSEPDVFSFEDLMNKPKKTEHWDGVRNYQARNFMRDDMKVGDQVLFYHSRTKEPGIYGLAEVSREAYPDFTSWDSKSPYFDPKSGPDNPRWMMVDVKGVKPFKNPVLLSEIKEDPGLETMLVIKKGMRLSIQPVDKKHFDRILKRGF